MPNYKQHDISILVTTPFVSTAAYVFSLDMVHTLFLTTAYLFSGFFLSPDLDIRSKIYLRWALFRWIWIPYQYFIPHRSVLSHSGPISATIRVGYLCIFVIPVLLVLKYLDIPSIYFIYIGYGVVYVWFGTVLSDLLHTFMDYRRVWFSFR